MLLLLSMEMNVEVVRDWLLEALGHALGFSHDGGAGS